MCSRFGPAEVTCGAAVCRRPWHQPKGGANGANGANGLMGRWGRRGRRPNGPRVRVQTFCTRQHVLAVSAVGHADIVRDQTLPFFKEVWTHEAMFELDSRSLWNEASASLRLVH